MKTFNAMILFAGFGLLVGAAGCGSHGSDPGLVGAIPGSVYGVICPAGQYAGPSGACSGDFSSACFAAGGFPSGKTCSITGSDGLMLLTPDNPVTYSRPIMNVPAGSVISFSGSGGWNALSPNSQSYLGGLIHINWTSASSANCSAIDLNGNQNATSVGSNLGLPEGLVGTAGSEVFMVGSNLTNKVLASGGLLRLGFNLPLSSYMNSYSTYLCGGYTGRLTITVP